MSGLRGKDDEPYGKAEAREFAWGSSSCIAGSCCCDRGCHTSTKSSVLARGATGSKMSWGTARAVPVTLVPSQAPKIMKLLPAYSRALSYSSTLVGTTQQYSGCQHHHMAHMWSKSSQLARLGRTGVFLMVQILRNSQDSKTAHPKLDLKGNLRGFTGVR